MYRSLKVILILISFISLNVRADVDAYQWCQAHMDNLKRLSSSDMTALLDRRKSISMASNVYQLGEATGKNYEEASRLMVAESKKSKVEADKFIMETMKSIEIDTLNNAISMHGEKNEKVWTDWYSSCVSANRK